MTIVAILQQPPPPPKKNNNNKHKAGKAMLGQESLKHAVLIIKDLFSLQVIQLSNSQIICDKDHYTIVYSNGTFKRCLLCGKCHEGYGLYPPCDSKLLHRPMTAECRSCKAGTFSSEYDSSSCKECNQCAEHEIKEAECTNKSDTACSGKCEAGYFMSETVYNCQECSACCSDGKDEKIKDCVSLGIKNKECSPRPDKTCASTGQPPTTAATKGSEGLAKKYLIIIIVSPIVVAIAVVIMIVMVCLRQKRKKAEERNGSSIGTCIGLPQ